ncbi:MAG: L-threonine 3-dehydrogenase [Gammaproteobacteria bacterium]|jgi:threonine 3-dehydrogenase|nr:L-threonine 3-dehydrogenase [Gammaproteobacteria bacterium]
MKALVKAKRECGLWLQHIAVPEYGPNDVLIKIKKAAICGTDLQIYTWNEWAQKTIPVPMAVGHECMGVVEAVGSEVCGIAVGDRVSVEGHITCGHCRNCRAGRRHLCHNILNLGVTRPGAFAEYLSMPAVNVFKLSPHISDDMGAILDPLGNAVHTTLSFDLVGEDVLITGAGPIGLMAIRIALQVGARNVVITDVDPYRLALAEKMGATRAVHIEKESLKDVMAQLSIVEGFDVGLEMSGKIHALQQMLATMNHGGRIALLGIIPGEEAIDWSQVIFKSLFIKGIYGREMFETWYKMSSLLNGGLEVSAIITHQFAMEDFDEAFKILQSGQAGKVILNW